MGRIFNVRLNLDDLSSHNDTFGTDAERGEWLRGFLAGARGAPCRFSDASPGFLGHSLGAESLAYAKQFHEQQAVHGARSAEVRKAKYGTAQPERPSNQPSSDPRTNLRATLEPTPNLSNNPIIHKENNPINQQTNNPITKRNRAAPQRSDAEQFIHDNKFRIKGTDTEKRSSIKDAVSHFGEVQVHTVMDRIRDVWASSLHAEIQTLIRDDFATKAKQDKLREEQNRIFA